MHLTYQNVSKRTSILTNRILYSFVIIPICRRRQQTCFDDAISKTLLKQEFVRPRWPYDMRPSARAEKYMCVILIR